MEVEKIKSEEYTSVAGVGSDPLPIYIARTNVKAKNSVISALFSRLINQSTNKNVVSCTNGFEMFEGG